MHVSKLRHRLYLVSLCNPFITYSITTYITYIYLECMLLFSGMCNYNNNHLSIFVLICMATQACEHMGQVYDM